MLFLVLSFPFSSFLTSSSMDRLSLELFKDDDVSTLLQGTCREGIRGAVLGCSVESNCEGPCVTRAPAEKEALNELAELVKLVSDDMLLCPEMFKSRISSSEMLLMEDWETMRKDCRICLIFFKPLEMGAVYVFGLLVEEHEEEEEVEIFRSPGLPASSFLRKMRACILRAFSLARLRASFASASRLLALSFSLSLDDTACDGCCASGVMVAVGLQI